MRSTIHHLHRKVTQFSYEEFMKRRGNPSLVLFLAWLILLAVLFFKY
jgi:hypothetical protein